MLTKLLILIVYVSLAACQQQEQTTTSASKHVVYTYDQNDKQTSKTNSETTIHLSDGEAKIDGAGAKEEKGKLTISQGGTYILSGSHKGTIIVDAKSDEIVHLVLKELTLNSSSGSPLQVQSAEKVVITLADDTTNTLSDGEGSVAAIHSKANLTINGTGALKITGNHQDGIQSERLLVLMSGSYDITAKNDGLKATDGVVVSSATVNLDVQGDGIVATNKEDKNKGYVLIEDGSFTISAANDGIKSETTTELVGGTYDIKTNSAATNNVKSKGIKSKGLIAISKGQYIIDSTDDAINATDIEISGGNMSLTAGDDAVHADEKLTISGGEILVTQSLEGIEGANILISGGTLNVTAIDDAINAATDSATEAAKLDITGGDIQLTASGDGIDVNGDLTIEGGTVTVFASPDSENMVIDYDNNFKLKGGTLIGVGTVGMIGDAPYAEMVTEYIQPTITAPVLAQYAGTPLLITDMNGNEIVNVTPTVHYAYVIVSSPTIAIGENYTITINGQPSATVQAMVSSTLSE